MGAFFISLADSRAAQLDQVETLYRVQGFSAIQRLNTRHFGLLYCRKQNLDSDSLYRPDADNFCLSTGTLLYRNAKGAEACERLWHDWQADCIANDQLFGNFALLLCRDGELHLYGDPQGVYPIWRAQDQRIFASGPLPLLLCAPRLTLLAQSVYEYVFQEAVFGGDTLFAEVARLTPGEAIRFAGTEPQRILPLITGQEDRGLSDDQRLDAIQERLRGQFRAIASSFGNEIDSSLSGGYDSRLLLALMREQSLSPHLHVYGQATSPDVTVAKAIASGETLDFTKVNKAEQPRLSET